MNESSVGVGGDSAGGRMAAMVCHDLPEIDYQVITANRSPGNNGSPLLCFRGRQSQHGWGRWGRRGEPHGGNRLS